MRSPQRTILVRSRTCSFLKGDNLLLGSAESLTFCPASVHPQDHIQSKVESSLGRLLLPCRLAYDLKLGLGAQHSVHSRAEPGVVVDYQLADALHYRPPLVYIRHYSSRAGSGNRVSTRVPPVEDAAHTMHLPPSSAARSRIEFRPTPVQ